MGFTCDVGESSIEAAYEGFAQAGVPEDKLFDVFYDACGWCYPHDNNTLLGICTCCRADHERVSAQFGGDWDAYFRAAARDWVTGDR